MKNENIPTCFDCQNAEIDEGSPQTYHEPGEPAYAYCKLHDVELYEDELDDPKCDARKCRHFKPTLIENCSECGRPINQPYYNWKYWVVFYDDQPVCCQVCKKIGQAKVNKEIEEMMGR